jgi:hypothetical protein
MCFGGLNRRAADVFSVEQKQQIQPWHRCNAGLRSRENGSYARQHTPHKLWLQVGYAGAVLHMHLMPQIRLLNVQQVQVSNALTATSQAAA